MRVARRFPVAALAAGLLAAVVSRADGQWFKYPTPGNVPRLASGAVNVNARDLAVMAATLANGGLNPVTKRQVLRNDLVPKVLAVMATAGLYDDSGKWLFTTGLPAKSGVGGGLIAVSPGKFGIAVVSPPLDSAGNSVKGQKAIADISAALGGNPYSARARGAMANR